MDHFPEPTRRLLEGLRGTQRYALTRFLGQGAFGLVFEALDRERNDAKVALKVLYRAEHPGALLRFKNEFRSLADITHPNLVMLFDLANHQDTWFFTMELVNGTSFLDHVWRTSEEPSATKPVATVSLTPASTAQSAFSSRGAAERNANAGRLDTARLRASLAQLVHGIATLHRARRLHRDLKPSNVLVDTQGRLVILDFGMVGDLSEASSSLRGVVGTPGYIAPEVTQGKAATEAADWYAVGAMLHEALTGTVPPRDLKWSLLGQKDAYASDAEDLAALALTLLAEDPNDRPSATDLFAFVSSTRRQEEPRSSEQPRHGLDSRVFVGRTRELSLLHDAFAKTRRGVLAGVTLEGASGVGKSALVRHFLEEARSQSEAPLVFSGRCYERESVPYKAFDEVVDALSQHLLSLTDAERHAFRPAQHTRALARLFPALRVIAEAEETPETTPDALDARELRRQAFGALKALLVRMAATRPVIVSIDDMQWGDPDSMALLEELLRAPDAPALLLLVSHREARRDDRSSSASDTREASSVLGLLDKAIKSTASSWTHVFVPPLDPTDARTLANAMLPPTSGGDGEAARTEKVDALLRESHGSPLFLKQLAERVIRQGDAWVAAPIALPDIIRERVSGLPEMSSDLVEVLSVAGRPLSEQLALDVAGIERSVAQPTLLRAKGAHLVLTRSTNQGVLLETAHDKVREAVAMSLSADRSRHWHKRLAETLRQLPAPDPEILVEHYLGAGDHTEAARFAVRAAAHANDVLAFDRAAKHLELALRLPAVDEARHDLLAMRAEALANAGRGAEAADSFREAASELERAAFVTRESAKDDVLTLRRRAGEHYLRSGRIDDGMAAMNDVLAHIGIPLPTSRVRALASMAVKRARLLARGIDFDEQDQNAVAKSKLARLDALWSATTSISMLNFVVADPLGVEHLLEALEAGIPSHVIRGLGYEAAFEAVLGGDFFNARCRRLLDRMDHMAARSAVPYDRAWAKMSRGITAWSLGDFATVVRQCDEAELLYREQCRGVAWELAVTDAFCLQSLASLGRIAELSKRVPDRLRAAEERGDIFAANILRLGHPNMIHLAAGDAERALEEANEGFAPIPKQTYITPHYHFLLATCQADLYERRGRRAFERIEADWPLIKSAQFLRAQCLRLEIRHLRARAAVAAACEGSTPSSKGRGRTTRDHLLREATHEANIIRRDALPLGGALGDVVLAAVAHLQGDEERSLSLLDDCQRRFDSLGLKLYREATRFVAGHLRHDASAMSESVSQMKREGIVNTAAMAGMLVPGFDLPTSS